MWTEYKKVSTLITAEMWKDMLESEGLPTKIIPETNILDWSEQTTFTVMVAKGREHVANEIIRKL